MLLEKIKREKWVTFIVESFKETGKIIDEESAKLIATLMQDHSWYVQQLAHYTWQKTSKKAGKEEVQAALTELLYANTPFYQREIESMSRGQLNLLKAIASDEKKLSSAEILEKYKLGTSASVVKNRTILMNNDLIHEVDDRVEFLDPAFELWFKNYFLNVPIS
jgi:ATP-dependent helicase YprA (DUF1998 family)